MAAPGPQCKQCGGCEMHENTSAGEIVCGSCGYVQEDNMIVADVQFAPDTQGGGIVGQAVGADGGAFSIMSTGFSGGFSRNSREISISNARKSMATLASSLSLHNSQVDRAHNYFKLAAHHRFIQGRRTEFVVASCLYVVCRKDKLPHMLLDFADALQVNVFKLGDVYMKLVSRLQIKGIPIIDPSLYIQRFTAKMDLGNKTHDVGRTALRIVARMRRDWIHLGRRPCGICGAALLLAARSHGFSRTQKEIVTIVRICDATLRKRLEEFEDTPSSSLTSKEFMTIDLGGECDPPAYKQARKKQKLAVGAKEMKVLAIEDGKGNASESTSTKEIEDNNSTTDKKQGVIDEKDESDEHAKLENELKQVVASVEFQPLKVLDDLPMLVSDQQPPYKQPPPPKTTATASSTVAVSKALVLIDPKDEEELSEVDSEIDEFILNAEEVSLKTEVWMGDNQAYLDKLKLREEQEAMDLSLGIFKPDKKKISKRKKEREKLMAAHTTTSDAIELMLGNKKKAQSGRIDYNVIKALELECDGEDEK
eukprot:m.125597 g.125597  ORF g.125597 m.125597 type:complete len:537 (+) comp29140_c0_seq1:59-1669(+)